LVGQNVSGMPLTTPEKRLPLMPMSARGASETEEIMVSDGLTA
jgi:hypothetical protein